MFEAFNRGSRDAKIAIRKQDRNGKTTETVIRNRLLDRELERDEDFKSITGYVIGNALQKTTSGLSRFILHLISRKHIPNEITIRVDGDGKPIQK